MKIEETDNKGFALSSFPHHGCLADEKKDRTNGISSFLVGEPFDERLMKDYPTDCQMFAYAYHQIISISDIINPTKYETDQTKKENLHQNICNTATANQLAGATGYVIRRADDAHGTAMHDGLDAVAGTGISHRRKIP